MANNEKLNGGQVENLNTLTDNASELQEALRNKIEREKSPENNAEKLENARHETEAVFETEGGKRGNIAAQPKQAMPKQKVIKKATKSQKQVEYKKTLKTIQKDMNTAERTFSKAIHNPVVEKASDVAGSTVARPAALLAGSFSALILTSIIYLVAKNYGYRLSGSEWILTFLIGWAIGLVIDWIRVALLGKRAGPA